MQSGHSTFSGSAMSAPPIQDERFRIEMTVGCGDAASIPKVLGAGRIMRRDGCEVQLMHNGVTVVAGGYYGDWMTEIIRRLSGHHEPQEEAVFHEIMKHMPESPTMIELGAFWSYYSLWCLQVRPAARVIGVEPDPHHLDIGKQNARLNGREIDFVNALAGGETLPPRPFQTEKSGLVELPQVSVPDIMGSRGLKQLDILHCDTQGAETAVLTSCFELLKEGAIRFCVVSTHHHRISGDPLTHQRCVAIIEQAGGQILAEHDVAESFSGDGLIAAYFGSEPIHWMDVKLSYNRYSTSLFRNPLFDLSERAR